MDNLQPGRNYSISVKAVSNGIESIERTVFQATRKYRSTGLAHSGVMSTGQSLYMSTYKAGHTVTQLFRRTGQAQSGMMSTGTISHYLSTRPAIPLHNCTGEQEQAIDEW